MRQAQSPVFDRIGKMLHDLFDEEVHKPLPTRWVDLIKHLNEKEQAKKKAARPKRHS